ncbi:MAG: arylsulfatase B, partial [Pseudohongiellaceae bacterium]
EHPDPPKTPRLDALAQQGMLFRNGWTNPSCSPSRATLLTGRYGFRTGIGSTVKFSESAADTWALPHEETTLAEAFATQGYRTAAVGKWHLANELSGGFYAPVIDGFMVHAGPIGNLPISTTGQDAYFDWSKNVAQRNEAVQAQVEAYATTQTVDDAITLIDTWSDKPWFLWVAFNAPHTPYHNPPAELHSVPLGPFPNPIKQYEAMVEALDGEIGRLLDSLDPVTRRNTLVIFLGDNGSPPLATSAPFIQGHAKGKVYEGGVNVPFIVSGPQVRAGTQCEGLVSTTDVFATLAELVGFDGSSASDSLSFAPLLRRPQTSSPRTWLYAEKFKPNGFGPKTESRRAIRGPRYKLILREGVSAPDMQFFDLALDPFEQNDLLPNLKSEEQLAYDQLASTLAGLQ